MKTAEDILHELSKPDLTWWEKVSIIESHAKERAVKFTGDEQPRIAYAKSESELEQIYDTFIKES